ncbi:hypothetical protein [Roseobacter sinensis]|uniref:DUF1127 domain-containing protein n=1 Tax=Roseobacter sinensis TaxID=2931391 RepID=A0ABT3BDY5_9RHOB|nr:hypothetical protein [Roseobacter sp. WL0113]MCV3271792.1 hypothetical protein [Roseobacter sp. WL0113]
MADVTRSRESQTFASKSQKNLLWEWLRWLKPAPKNPDLSRISDHLARDIGLSKAQIERYRLKLPSETTYHPRG